MEVAISTLRAELAQWVRRARDGDDVVVTERGIPVARLTPVDQESLIERLTREGVLSKPTRPKRPIEETVEPVHGRGLVSELVEQDRR
jgi:prevent-host-death family protein